MANAGQTCIGIERVYATAKSYDGFLAALQDKVVKVQAGTSYGHITMPSQAEIIRNHIADAISHGGTAISGGRVDGTLVEPTVLTNVPEESTAVQEETFGPTLTVTKVKDVEEALVLANSTSYGLAGAVYSRRSGMEIARKLRSGMTSINSVQAFAAIPSLPFGGMGESGFGRIHGEDGLREFTRAKSITQQRMRPLLALTTFDRTERADKMLMRVVKLLYGRK
jgi:acyl-CoA reductase-like NAD-dependent aldehyde dehydrogenase